MIAFFLPLILMFGIFYFLLIRPQNKERDRLNELIKALKKGDKIILNSGIVGEVDMIQEDSDEFIMKSEGTRLKVKKQAIVRKIEDENEN